MLPFSLVKVTSLYPRSDPQSKLKNGLSIEKKLWNFPPLLPVFFATSSSLYSNFRVHFPTTTFGRSFPPSSSSSPPNQWWPTFSATDCGLGYGGEGKYGRTRDRNPTPSPAGWLLAGRLAFANQDIYSRRTISKLSLQFLLPRGKIACMPRCAVGTILQTATLKKKETSILDPDSHKLNCSVNNLSSLLFGPK